MCSAQNPIGRTSKQFTLIVLETSVYSSVTTTTTTISYETNSRTKEQQSKDFRLFCFYSLLENIPYLIISPHYLILDYHDKLELICQTNLLRTQDIQWLHNGNLVSKQFYLTDFSHRNILRISRIADQHAGIYQCFSNSSDNQQIIMSESVMVTVRRRSFVC